MNNVFNGIFDCIKRKKWFFILLIIFSVAAVVLGIISAINLGGVLTIDLSRVAYIKFLRGGGFASLLFGLLLGLAIFFIIIFVCNLKPFLVPIGIVFYLYLIYSQTVIFISMILIYGIFNCIILAVFLLIYNVIVWALFLLIMCELVCLVGAIGYFKKCFSLRESKTLLFLICLILVSLIFTIVLAVLKNYVILLVFN